MRDPLHHVRVGIRSDTLTWTPTEERCGATFDMDVCTRRRGHPGKHISATSPHLPRGGTVKAVWPQGDPDPAPWKDTARAVIIELGTTHGLSTSKINEKLGEAGLDEVGKTYEVTVRATFRVTDVVGQAAAIEAGKTRAREAGAELVTWEHLREVDA